MSLPKQPVIPNAPPTSTILTIPPLIPPFTQGGTVWVIPFTQGGARYGLSLLHKGWVLLYTRGHGVGYPFYTRGGYRFTQGVGIALHKWGYPFVVHKNFIFYKSAKTYYRIHGPSRDFRYTKIPCRLKRPAGPAYPNIKHMGRRRAPPPYNFSFLNYPKNALKTDDPSMMFSRPPLRAYTPKSRRHLHNSNHRSTRSAFLRLRSR